MFPAGLIASLILGLAMRRAFFKSVAGIAVLLSLPWSALAQAQDDEQALQAGVMKVLIVYDAPQRVYGKL